MAIGSRFVHLALLALGYNLGSTGADGIQGKFTNAELRAFKDSHILDSKNNLSDTQLDAQLVAEAPKKQQVPAAVRQSAARQQQEQAAAPVSPDSPAADKRETQRLLMAAGLEVNNDGKADGIFLDKTVEAVREYRRIMGYEGQRDNLSRDEARELARIEKLAQQDVNADRRERAQRSDKSGGLSLETATALRIASERTGVDLEQLESSRFRFNAPTWLHMVKTHGDKYGLDYMASQIEQRDQGAHISHVAVADPATLRQILSLRDNPRVAALMSAEYIKDRPPVAHYVGAGTQPEPGVAEMQQALTTLGFDLGIRVADGVRGPLTIAALQEYKAMKQRTPGNAALTDDKLGEMLVADAKKATDDAARYAKGGHQVSPAQAFSVRHAAQATGDKLPYMMALAAQESAFDNNARPLDSKGCATSSAVGLYQFTDDTWLAMMHRHGAEHGLGHLSRHIKVTQSGSIITSAKVDDPFIRQTIMDLRRDPHVAAAMGAELAGESRHVADMGDRYMFHFLGAGAGQQLLAASKNNPSASAADMFQAEAISNKGVFYKKGEDGGLVARTVKEVRDYYAKSFDSVAVAFNDPRSSGTMLASRKPSGGTAPASQR